MSVMIYMTVEVQDEQVKPNVHVTTFGALSSMHGEGSLKEISMQDVRFGLEVAKEVLDFAGRLEQESS